jgi:hypothetical protein
MKTFDLPKDIAEFLAHSDWDFTLSNLEHPIQVSLQEIEGLKEDDELGYLKTVVIGIIAKAGEARKIAADSYLDEYNEKWSKGDLITKEEFIARMKIGSITIPDRKEVFLEFDDGSDMFWGHALSVRFNSEFDIQEVTLEG